MRKFNCRKNLMITDNNKTNECTSIQQVKIPVNIPVRKSIQERYICVYELY